MDKIFFLITLLVSPLVFMSAQSLAPEFTFEVKATLKDLERNPLAGMSLFVEGDNFKKTVVSDENGLFSIKLPAGKFTIRGNETVAKNFLTFLEISADKPNPTNFDLIVETNQICCTPTSDGKPTEIVKYVFPPYPPAAKAVRASGEVIVAVKIDKDGNVISAKAESGHALLKTASELASKQFLFTKDEKSIEREGKIIFIFIADYKKKPLSIFRKPNYIIIFPEIPQIDF
jgi:hypothetical protein